MLPGHWTIILFHLIEMKFLFLIFLTSVVNYH